MRRLKDLLAQTWQRLKMWLAGAPQAAKTEPLEAPSTAAAAQPQATERSDRTAEEATVPAMPPAAEADEASGALLKPSPWMTGVARSEAGRMMPWVFVPPERKYRLYVPSSAPEATRRAMVVMLHGCRQDAETFARGTRFNQFADQYSLVVLYPDQADLANTQRCWNWFEARTLVGKGEAAILIAMIERAVRRAQVDPERVVIAGLSSGAALAALLAYQQPARFAGVVVHSGPPPHAAHSAASALHIMRDGPKLDLAELTQRYWASQQLPPPPLRVIHGDADDVVHPSNANALIELWASLREAEMPGLLTREQRSVTSAGVRNYEVTTLRAGEDLVAEKILVQGLGHAWSGGDASLPFNDAREPSASALIAQWVEQVAAQESDVR